MASVPGLKRRLVCGFILVVLGFVTVNFWDDPGTGGRAAPPFLGALCGLFLGVLHFPGSGFTRGTSRKCKVIVCTLIVMLTVIAGTYPWHQIPAIGGKLGEQSDVWRKRWVMLFACGFLAAICVICMLKPHPPSTYAHDAKWCTFGLWLCMMVYPLYYVRKGHKYTKAGDFFVALTLSMESVVLGWIVCIFQARMVGMKSRHTSGKLSSQLWIVLMRGAFLSLALSIAVNRAMGKDSQEGLIMRIIVQTMFLSMWAWYTFDVCRSFWRALRLLQIEAGRVRGPPRRQAFWAAKIVCVELLLCMLLGSTTFFTWFLITILKYVQLVNHDAYKEFLSSTWGIGLSAMRRFDVGINSLSLALLSGILWQDEPPTDVDAETRSRSQSRGLSSMSANLAVDDQAVYVAVVRQLARRGFRLGSLLDFWQQLLEGDEYMPRFDP
ncbi:BPM2, partial [Symbiodinium pilosum]